MQITTQPTDDRALLPSRPVDTDFVPFLREMQAKLNHGRLTKQDRQQIDEIQHINLRDEFVRGFLADPQTIISTPGFDRPTHVVEWVVYDHFAGEQGQAHWIEMLRIVAMASHLPGEIGLRASALIATIGNCHAEFHAGEVRHD